jgi:hypothetical protein
MAGLGWLSPRRLPHLPHLPGGAAGRGGHGLRRSGPALSPVGIQDDVPALGRHLLAHG